MRVVLALLILAGCKAESSCEVFLREGGWTRIEGTCDDEVVERSTDVTQSSRVRADALLDVFLAEQRFDVEAVRSALEKDGWKVGDCVARRRFGSCAGMKATSLASISFDTPEQALPDSRSYERGVAKWSRHPNTVHVTVLEKFVSPPTP